MIESKDIIPNNSFKLKSGNGTLVCVNFQSITLPDYQKKLNFKTNESQKF